MDYINGDVTPYRIVQALRELVASGVSKNSICVNSGIKSNSLIGYLNGTIMPDAVNQQRLSAYLKLPVDYLMAPRPPSREEVLDAVKGLPQQEQAWIVSELLSSLVPPTTEDSKK